MTATFPIDFDAHRAALVREVQLATQVTCILAEPNDLRPARPYFSMKMTTPAGKYGDDSAAEVGSTTVWNRGGQRKMVVDFNCYGCTHEQAYGLMALWQSWLELETTQARLYAAGIAVWLNGSVTDLSQLLNAGFEGRAHMSVDFGIAANLTEDLGAIETVNVDGEVLNGVETIAVDVTVTAP